jgi:hypothetical protein
MAAVAKSGQKDALALFPWLMRRQIGSILVFDSPPRKKSQMLFCLFPTNNKL